MDTKTFKTIEEMTNYFAACEHAADSRILPWQREFKIGDYFLRVTDDGYGEPVVIFGEIFESPYAEDRAHYTQPSMANHRLAKCYSVLCVEGETGSVHISTMHLRLTKAEFEAAKERRWKPDMLEMLRAYEAQYSPASL